MRRGCLLAGVLLAACPDAGMTESSGSGESGESGITRESSDSSGSSGLTTDTLASTSTTADTTTVPTTTATTSGPLDTTSSTTTDTSTGEPPDPVCNHIQPCDACTCTDAGVSWQMARMSCPSAVMSFHGVFPASAW